MSDIGGSLGILFVGQPQDEGFDVIIRFRPRPRRINAKALRNKARKELPIMTETIEAHANPYVHKNVKPLAVDVVIRGTRRLRRAFKKFGKEAVDATEKAGPKLRVGVLLVADLAWLFAVSYLCLQFMSYVLATNPLLFWVVIAGFVMQLGTKGYLKRSLRDLIGEKRLESWAAE